jgi:transcription antitermination protein NusB
VTQAPRSSVRPRTRTASRVAAVQALFQSEQAKENPETVIDQFVRHRLGESPGGANEGAQGGGAQGGSAGYEDGRNPDAEVPLFTSIVRAAVRQQDTIDAMVADALPPDWPLARIDPVLRAILRAGGAELASPLSAAGSVPAKVVINEYLDIARGFFSGPEPGLANAVLDRLARLLRDSEF